MYTPDDIEFLTAQAAADADAELAYQRMMGLTLRQKRRTSCNPHRAAPMPDERRGFDGKPPLALCQGGGQYSTRLTPAWASPAPWTPPPAPTPSAGYRAPPVAATAYAHPVPPGARHAVRPATPPDARHSSAPRCFG
jgi:hypothetical protein